jgi:FixJ family two-component response regulator
VARQRSPTVAILSDDTVVGSALRLLLEGVGYSTRILRERSATGSATGTREQLEGVDLLLLAPSLREEDREGFLEALEAAPTTVDVPILTLSTAPQEELVGRTGTVPWPIPFEDLCRAIEAALATRKSYRGTGEPNF